MGVTVSHTTLAPVSLASTLIGFISFAFTLATFFNVFWSSLQTIHAAPSEINDFLSGLKQGLLEERRHLRKVRKRIRSARRDRSHIRTGSDSDPGAGGDGGGGSRRRWSRGRRKSGGARYAPTHFDRDEQAFKSQGESDNLRVMRVAVRDMIKSFRRTEYPFLKLEYQNADSAHWSTNTPSEKPPNFNHPYGAQYQASASDDESGLHRSNRFGNEYRKCGFRERWLWLRRKQDVINMSEGLARLQTRRISHDVGEVLLMLGDVGRDLDDMRGAVLGLEGRMSRVVGIRRVD